MDRPVVEMDVTYNPDDASGDSDLRVELGDFSRVPTDTHLWIAVFDIEETTLITTGENHDKTLISHNIVREFEQLTPSGGIAELAVENNAPTINHQVSLKEGQGCAVLLQDAQLGIIHGAAYCPKSMWKQST